MSVKTLSRLNILRARSKVKATSSSKFPRTQGKCTFRIEDRKQLLTLSWQDRICKTVRFESLVVVTEIEQ